MATESVAIFAYGTLKQGFRNHAAYCRGALAVHPAEAWGRLYTLQPGIPILELPDDQVLLLGSQDVARDLAAADALPADDAADSERTRPGGWRRIQGDLLIFPDAEARLRLFDAFEGVHPRTELGYVRALCPVRRRDGRSAPSRAWCYVLPPDADPPGEALRTDDWLPERDG